jgi:hypothetical protein
MSTTQTGWENVLLADVVPETQEFSEVPAGEYVFNLNPGASYRTNKGGVQEIHAAATIASGDQQGRWVFFNYPDPTSTDKNGKARTWSAQALKKLELSLGLDANPGEDSVAYLNRAATNGHSTFKAAVKARTYTDASGNPKTAADFQLFSVAPAAI